MSSNLFVDTRAMPGAFASMVSLHQTVSSGASSPYSYATPSSPTSSSVTLPLSPTSSRRPSEIRRKPVPRLSDAEQHLLAQHDQARDRLPSLSYTRSSGSAASFFPPASRRMSVASPLELQQVAGKSKPNVVSPAATAASRKPSLASASSGNGTSAATSPAYSPSVTETPFSILEASDYRFPLPPSPVPAPSPGRWVAGYSPVAAPIQRDGAAEPSRKTSGIPPEVMEDCGCDAEDASSSRQRQTTAMSSVSVPYSQSSANEQLDSLGDLVRSTATGYTSSSGQGDSVRLSHYRWQSGSKRVPVPHSRSETQDTDVFPSAVTVVSDDGTFGRSVSISSQDSASSVSSSISSGNESIFDSYHGQQSEEAIMRHGSLASTETNVSLNTALNLGDDELAKSAQEGHVESRRQRQLSTVGEEQSMRTRGSSNAQLYDRALDSIDVAAYGSLSSEYSNSSGLSDSPSSSASSTPSKRERKLARKALKKREFSQFAKPTTEELLNAADAMVYTEQGDLVRFGDLWEGQRTIVCFIRHYWCPSCQDYMASIMRITPEQLRALNLRLIVVGCGNWKMISGYRSMLANCPFPIVSDPTRALYRQFGMTRTSMSPGAKPDYVQHGMAVNTLISLKRNLAMPLKDPGELGGLGGEFVLGPGLECTYAHRMKNTRDHAELQDILKALGVMLPDSLARQLGSPARPQKEAPLSPSRKLSMVGRSGGEGKLVIRLIDNQELRS